VAAATTSSTTPNADDEHQSAFVRTFLMVLAFLTAFTLFCVIVARMLSGSASGVENDPILRADVVSRIAPVASVRTSADADADGGAGVTATSQSGEEIVQGACAACHASGVAGAPKLDDEVAWASRREAGMDTLLASVINGKGAMPARAGTSLSDDELKRAVAHMAGFEIEDSSGSAATEETAATDTEAKTDTDASAEKTESTESKEATEQASTETAASTATATSETATTGTAAAATATATAAATTATAATATAAATVQNDAAPEMVAGELTDRVKSVADGICSACHMSGVGGAPKVGDKDAWNVRAEKGLGGMTAVVVAGKGAMPARGGSDLSDEEIATAIVYLMEK